MTESLQTDVLRDEAVFADKYYARYANELAVNPQMFNMYRSPSRLWNYREKMGSLFGDLAGKSVLDLGCGMGEEAIYLAKLGARVSAIDISEVGIAITRQRAAFNDVSDRVAAYVMQATPTEFPPATFDLVHGIGILHHVGLDAGLREVQRILKPGGGAIFWEPLGNSPLIEKCKEYVAKRFGRRFRLHDVTEHEENLKLRELRGYRTEFAYFRLYPYHLFYRIRKLVFPVWMRDWVRAFDYQLLRAMPFLSYYAGGVLLHLKK